MKRYLASTNDDVQEWGYLEGYNERTFLFSLVSSQEKSKVCGSVFSFMNGIWDKNFNVHLKTFVIPLETTEEIEDEKQIGLQWAKEKNLCCASQSAEFQGQTWRGNPLCVIYK